MLHAGPVPDTPVAVPLETGVIIAPAITSGAEFESYATAAAVHMDSAVTQRRVFIC
jgi:hypothetical protein